MKYSFHCHKTPTVDPSDVLRETGCQRARVYKYNSRCAQESRRN